MRLKSSAHERRVAMPSENNGMLANISDPLVQIPFRRQDDEVRLSGIQSFSRADTEDPLNPGFATAVTYVDALTGLIKKAPFNSPRFEKMSDGGTGILLEGSSTNAITSSNTTFVDSNIAGGETLSTSVVAGPSGAVEGQTITQANGTFVGIYGNVYSYISSSTVANTLSMWVKAPVGVEFYFSLLDSIAGDLPYTTYHTGTGEWKRYSTVFGGVTAGATVRPYIWSTNNGAVNWVNGDEMHVSSVQLEALPFASSYIPTTGTALTRNVDILSIEADGNFSDNQFSFIFDFESKNIGYINGLDRNIFGVDGYGWILGRDNNPRIADVAKFYPLTTQSNVVHRSGMIFDNILHEYKTSIDGQVSAPSTTVPLTQNSVPQFIAIGSRNKFNYRWYGHLRNFRIYDRALTNEEVAAA